MAFLLLQLMEPKTRVKEVVKVLRSLVMEGDSRAKLFFLLLSVFLWFLINLSNDGYKTVVEFPIEYLNLPQDRILAEAPPKYIKVDLVGPGFSLLKYKIRGLKSIAVDVSRLKRDSDTIGALSYWLTNENLGFVAAQLEGETQVLSISPDTIAFKFTELGTKKVPIVLQLDKQYSNQTSLYGKPKLSIDSLVVTGPKLKLASIESIMTKSILLTGEEDSITISSKLKLPEDKALEFSHQKVKVTLAFTQITEGKLQVPINIEGVSGDYELAVFPKKVDITYRISIHDFKKIGEADFKASVDYALIKGQEESRYLPVKVESYSDFVKYINYEPKRVEYILTEK